MTNKKKSIVEKLDEFGNVSKIAISKVYMIITMTLMVFVLTNGYFNTLETKAIFALVFTTVYVVISAIFCLFNFTKTPAKEYLKNTFDSFNMMDHAILLFGFAAILSNFTTNHMKEAFYGSFAWRIGTLFIVFMCLAYLFLSRNIVFSEKLLLVLEISVGVESVWVLLNSFMVDPFWLHARVAAKDYRRYVGTIGNVNWYVGFLSLVIPILFVVALLVKKTWQKVMTKVVLIVTFMTAFTCNCDGMFLSIYVLAFLFVIFGLANKERLSRVLFIALLMCLSLGVLALFRKLLPCVKLNGVSNYILTHYVWLIAAIVIALVLIFVRMMTDEFFDLVKKKVQIVLLIAFALVFVALLIWQFSKITDKWGHNRGKIWKSALSAFSNMPFINKLFGGGVSNFGYYYLQETGSDWVRNAHNVYLEYLVTTGIFGVLCYLMTIVGIIVSGLKDLLEGKRELTCQLKASLFIGLLSYAAQGLVNNPQGLNAIVLVCVLATYRKISLELKKEEIE